MKIDQRKILTFLFFIFCSIFVIGLSKSFSNNVIKEYSDFYLKGNTISCLLCFFFLLSSKFFFEENLSKKNTSNDTNCRNRTIDEFPPDFLTEEQNKNGG
jgi:hypothetical protein